MRYSRWFTLFLVTMMLAVQPLQAAEKPVLTLVVKSLANGFFTAMVAGARQHAAANSEKYTLLATGIPNETDVAGQIKLIEQAIAAKTQALIIAPANSTALVPVLKKAHDNGIVIINIDNKLDDQALAEQGLSIPFVGPSNRAGARMAADYLAKRLRADDEVAIIEGISKTVNAQARTAGARDALQAMGAKLVAVRSGEWETLEAQKIAADILQTHPKLKAFVCGNDNMALGAIAALNSTGQAGKVMVVGYDNIPAVKPYLKNGQLLATVDQFGEKQAIFGIELALNALADKTPSYMLPPIVQTPVQLVTQ